MAGILLVAAAVCLLLSLVSYHPADPSFFSYTSSKLKDIHNWMGVVGAYVSSFLFQALGFSCFLIPFVLGIFALSFIFRWPWKYPLVKGLGWLAILLASASLLGLWLKPLHFHQQEVLAGGFIGEIFSRSLARYFNGVGASILLWLILILAFVLGTGLSFIALVQTVGSGASRLIDKISTFKMVRKEQVKRAKALMKQKQEKQEKEKGSGKETAPPVVVEPSSSLAKAEEIIEQEAFEFTRSKGAFQLPPVSLLEAEIENRQKLDRDSLLMNARILEKKLLDYGVEGKVVEVRPGPVITVYEFEPAPGVKVSRIVNLADDLALALSAISIRIVAPIPGKAVVGIEIPNPVRETVFLKEIIDSDTFRVSKSKLSFGLGKDISGEPFVVDLGKMPHLLVAGSTGSGKSVSINAMICSILYKATAEEARFIMIDPKMLELSDYCRHPPPPASGGHQSQEGRHGPPVAGGGDGTPLYGAGGKRGQEH